MKSSPLLFASLALSVAAAAWVIRFSESTAPEAAPLFPGPPSAAAPEATAPARAERPPTRPLEGLPNGAPSLTSTGSSLSSTPFLAPPAPRRTGATSAGPGGSFETASDPNPLPPLLVRAGAPPIPGRAVNSSAPGNFLRFRGTRIAVAGSYESGNPGDRALAMDLSSEAAESGHPVRSGPGLFDGSAEMIADTPSPDAPEAPPGGGSPEGPAIVQKPRGPAQPNGLSREDQLFRMKWGWAAYDAAQREALRDAGK